MRLLPWRPLCEHVFRHGSRAGAPALTTASELREYLLGWSARSAWVRDTLQWKGTPSAMRKICRLGAWLGDSVNMEICIRAGTRRSNVRYVVLLHSSYKWLAPILGFDCGVLSDSGVNSSANHVGNVFERLMWLALEEDRCEWILGILREASRRDTTAFRSTLAVGHAT